MKRRKKYQNGGAVDDITELYPDIIKAVIQSSGGYLQQDEVPTTGLGRQRNFNLDMNFSEPQIPQPTKSNPIEKVEKVQKKEGVEKPQEIEDIEDLDGVPKRRSRRTLSLDDVLRPTGVGTRSSTSSNYGKLGVLAPDLKKYFEDKGVPSHVSAGLVANLQAESSLDPNAINPTSKAFGLGQWLGKRKTGLEKFAKQQGRDINDPYLQADYILHEFGTTESKAYREALKATNSQQAADAFMHHYERPSEEEKMKTVNKRRKAAKDVEKYLEGGQITGGYGNLIGAGLDGIFKIADALSNSPAAYSDQPIMAIKPTSMAVNPYSRSFQFAQGGMIPNNLVPVEVEGDEVAETPQGDLMQFDGPTHEQGGIDVSLPGNTKVYSDRLKINGETMQKRKLNREKSAQKIQAILDNNPVDVIAKGALARTQMANDIEDQADMAYQEAIRAQKEEFASGGTIHIKPENRGKFNALKKRTGKTTEELTHSKNPLTRKRAIFAQNAAKWKHANGGYVYDPIQGLIQIAPTQDGVVNDNDLGLGESINVPQGNNFSAWESQFMQTPNISPVANETQSNQIGQRSPLGALTIGDTVGMIGSLAGSIAPLANTLNSAQGNRPNPNFYQNFGKDALDSNQSAIGYVDAQRSNQLTNLNTQTNAARASNRNSARNINTLRALDLAVDKQSQVASNSIYNTFSQQMMGLLGQRGQLQNTRDQFTMSGAHQADIANRQDRGALASNISRDLSSLFGGVQAFGRQLNQVQQKNDQLDILPDLSKYGLGYVKDQNGNWVLTRLR